MTVSFNKPAKKNKKIIKVLEIFQGKEKNQNKREIKRKVFKL